MKSLQRTLIIILLSTIHAHTYTMKLPSKVRKTANSIGRWLLGKDNRFSFMELPAEIQSHIVELMAQYSDAESLASASETLRTLSQVSSTFYKLINNTSFNEQLVSHLADRFGCSLNKAALALSTPAAKKYLNNYYVTSNDSHNIALFIESDNDINEPLDDQGNTPLMIAIHQRAFKSASELLKNKNINMAAHNDHDDNIFHVALYTLSLLKAQGNTKMYAQLKRMILQMLALCNNDAQQAELIWALNKSGETPWDILQSLDDDKFAKQLYKAMGMM